MDVTIRPLREEDAYTSVKWRNDPEVFKYTGNTYDHVITIESELSWIKKVMTSPTDYRCAIIADGKYVGNIYLHDITKDDAIYSIFIGEKNYWGKGVAKKASLLIIKYGFEDLNLKEITLKVKGLNARAVSLYKSIGFQEYESDFEWISMKILNKEQFRNE